MKLPNALQGILNLDQFGYVLPVTLYETVDYGQKQPPKTEQMPGNTVNNKSPFLKIILPVIGLFLLGGLLYTLRNGKLAQSSQRQNAALSQSQSSVLGAQVPVPSALATTPVGKEFTFTLSNGREKANIKFLIDTAQLQNEIIVNGQKATAVAGKSFMILNTKITNDNKNPVSLNTRDYVRLENPGTAGEWLAPEVYNDPVEIQAISTKYSRLGFTVDTKYRDFKLQVGEINGTKEVIELHF